MVAALDPTAGRRRWPTGWVAVGLAFVVGVVIPRVLFFPVVNLGPDEVTYGLVGRSLLEGHLPYQGAFDHKPAALYVPYAVVQLVFGQTTTALRALSLVIAVIAFTLVVAVARRLETSLGAAALLGLLYSFLSIGNQGAGALTEPLLNVYVLAIILLLLRPARAPGALLLGALTALAVHTNYIVGPIVAALGVAYLWRERRALTRWGWAATGFVIVSAAVLVPIAIWSDLGEYFRLQITFLRAYGKAPTSAATWVSDAADLLLPMLAVLTVAVVVSVMGDRDRLRRAGPWYALVLTAVVAMLAGGHFFPHYSILVAAPLVALVASQVGRLDRGGVVVAGLAVLVAGLTSVVPILPGLAHGADVVARQGNLAPDQAATQSRVAASLGQVIRPGDVIYSYDPRYYYVTGAALPTRFVFRSHHLSETLTAARGSSPEAELRTIFGHAPVAVVTKGRLNQQPAPVQDYLRQRCRPHESIKSVAVWDCRDGLPGRAP